MLTASGVVIISLGGTKAVSVASRQSLTGGSAVLLVMESVLHRITRWKNNDVCDICHCYLKNNNEVVESPKKEKSREKNAEIDFPGREDLKIENVLWDGLGVVRWLGAHNVIGSGDWMGIIPCPIMGPNQIHIFMWMKNIATRWVSMTCLASLWETAS